MNMIESIYELAIEDYDSKDSKEFLASTKAINEFLKIVPLEHTKIVTLDELISTSQVAAEKQGFESGFKYAMSLIKECGLND